VSEASVHFFSPSPSKKSSNLFFGSVVFSIFVNVKSVECLCEIINRRLQLYSTKETQMNRTNWN
jgi:hypothetical protein